MIVVDLSKYTTDFCIMHDVDDARIIAEEYNLANNFDEVKILVSPKTLNITPAFFIELLRERSKNYPDDNFRKYIKIDTNNRNIKSSFKNAIISLNTCRTNQNKTLKEANYVTV